MRLSGKVAIITGATSGIGRAAGRVFAAEGARVVLFGRRAEKGHDAEAEIRAQGGEALFVPGDVTSEEDVARLAAETLSAFGAVHVLFNNAGINPLAARKPVDELSDAAWEAVIATNLTGVLRCTRAVIPHMRRAGGGAIVNTSSTFGLVGAKNRAAYAASKGAVTQLTKAMALDYGPENIRVNCICPGMTLNDRVTEMVEEARREGRLEAILADYALRRLGTCEEVARVAAFLASEDASWVTGAAVPVDGGYTAR